MDLNTIYLICAVAGGTVLVLRLIAMVFGLGSGGEAPDVSADMDVDAAMDIGEHGAGAEANYLSIQSLSGFFTMFGLVGMGLLQVNAGPLWSLVGALAAGVFTAWVTAMIAAALLRLQSSGTLQISNAVGQEGTVYLTIPDQGSGVVSVSVQGALRQFDALSENGQKIPTGTLVRVTGVSAGKLVVAVMTTASQTIGGNE
jgi:membrane protein implicated in regulation of membrane protease activity